MRYNINSATKFGQIEKERERERERVRERERERERGGGPSHEITNTYIVYWLTVLPCCPYTDAL